MTVRTTTEEGHVAGCNDRGLVTLSMHFVPLNEKLPEPSPGWEWIRCVRKTSIITTHDTPLLREEISLPEALMQSIKKGT